MAKRINDLLTGFMIPVVLAGAGWCFRDCLKNDSKKPVHLNALETPIVQFYKDIEKPKLEPKYLSNNTEEINNSKSRKINNPRDYFTENLSSDSNEMLLARMLYGEARGCKDNEKIAIAYTAINRANDRKKWNGENLKEALLKPYQYSCFNYNDINRKKLMNPENTDSFENCLRISKEVLNGKYSELNLGQTHYFNPKICSPKWAKKLDKIGTINDSEHLFYKEN